MKNEGGRRTITVRGAGAIGAMYGGLDIVEAIRTGTLDSLQDSDHTPHIQQRGIKFNLPLDVRTPTYSKGEWQDSERLNVPEMWSINFWRTTFDDMARHRFNLISCWSLQPFPQHREGAGVPPRRAGRCREHRREQERAHRREEDDH